MPIGRDGGFHTYGVLQVERPKRRVEQVAAHIAKGACAKIAPRAPGAGQVTRMIWAEPLVPIQARGNGRGFLGTLDFHTLGPYWPIGPNMDLPHGPNRAGGYPLADHPSPIARMTLVTHLAHDLVLARRLRQGAGLEDRMRQWLLHIETPIHFFASGKFNRLTCAALSTCERPTRPPNGACQEARFPLGLSMTLVSNANGSRN